MDKQQYAKIMDMYDNGDERARNFLLNYPNMTAEEADECVRSLLEPKKDPIEALSAMLPSLIKGEIQAIGDYGNAIALFSDSGGAVKDKLEEIKKEEEMHLQELKAMCEPKKEDKGDGDSK